MTKVRKFDSGAKKPEKEPFMVEVPDRTDLNKLPKGRHSPPNRKADQTRSADAGKNPESAIHAKPKIIKIREYLSAKYDFRLNEVSNEIEFRLKEENTFALLNENDLFCELMEGGLIGVEKTLLALLASKFVPRYNPFQDYFESLPAWDPGQPDYIAQLSAYIHTKDPEWFTLQFRKMLARTIACATGVIPFNKHCFTLVGKQNDGKTRFLRFLCPTPLSNYIKENLDIQNKDGRFALCQNLFINLDELATLSKHDINQTKAFFTIDKVKDRLPYDRKPTTFPRRASFLASTNKDEFLTDETGNVRWLVFEIDGINHDNGGPNGYGNNINMDLVYSQAAYLLKSGYKFELTPEELEKSEKNNQRFQVTTTEEELIQRYYQPGNHADEFLTPSDIEEQLSSLTNGRVKVNRHSIGRALKSLGFVQIQKHIKAYNQQRKGYLVKRLFETSEP